MILYFLFCTFSPTIYSKLLFHCLKYFTVLLETSFFRFFTASLALSVFCSLLLMISIDGCSYGWTSGSLSFSIDFPHQSISLDFLPKYTSKADFQPSFCFFFFSFLRHLAYFCKFYDQLTPACFCVSRSYVIYFLKGLCDRSTFPCDWGWYGLLFVISIFLFFCKMFWLHHKILFIYHFELS